MSGSAVPAPELSSSLCDLVEEIADFAVLVRLLRMWEIGWVAESGGSQSDPTVFDRLIARLRQLVPPDYVIADDDDSPAVLEEALEATYCFSGSVDGNEVRLSFTDATLFGQVSLETNVGYAGAAVAVVSAGRMGRGGSARFFGPIIRATR